MKKSQSQLCVNSDLCRSSHPHCMRSAAALGQPGPARWDSWRAEEWVPLGSVSPPPAKRGSGEGPVLFRSNSVNLVLWILNKGIGKAPRQWDRFPGQRQKGVCRRDAGQRRCCAPGRGAAVRGRASCQPSPRPTHGPLPQAPTVLPGGESQPPASLSAVEENVNSARGFVPLSLCWCDVLLQIRFEQHGEDGVRLLK